MRGRHLSANAGLCFPGVVGSSEHKALTMETNLKKSIQFIGLFVVFSLQSLLILTAVEKWHRLHQMTFENCAKMYSTEFYSMSVFV